MKVLILGAGLLGVTTAYELGKRGFEVTVIDRQPESAAECSHANGGQLSFSHAEPWASPSVLPKLPKWLVSPDAPLVFRPRADWQMIRWGLKFLRNCTNARAYDNCVNLLRINLYSKEQMEALCSETGIQFDYAKAGILNMYTDEKEFDQAKRQVEFQAKFGGDERILSRQECLALEPSLQHTSRTVIGGIHDFGDATGDAYKFCAALAKLAAERYGVIFHYGITVKKLVKKNGTVAAVVTDQGELSADAYVMAMGSYSPIFLRPVGIDLPIYPMKGYSVTIKANDACPRASVADGTSKVVYTRLGDRMRIAGTAEFGGYSDAINEKRIKPILKSARELFPKADWNQTIEKWACLRPSTPDGPPVIGVTTCRNLFLNTGHGTLGWTQAAGSATLLADIMEGKPPAIMLHGLTMERYL